MEFQIRTSSDVRQPYYWRIVAANGKILATSETYHHRADAIAAAGSVQRNAAGARIVDLTARAA